MQGHSSYVSQTSCEAGSCFQIPVHTVLGIACLGMDCSPHMAEIQRLRYQGIETTCFNLNKFQIIFDWVSQKI